MSDELDNLSTFSTGPTLSAPLNVHEMLATMELFQARMLLASTKVERDERLPDDRVYVLAAGFLGRRARLVGSTRALGALAAGHLAAAYRPDGVP